MRSTARPSPATSIRPLSGVALSLILALPTLGSAADDQSAYGARPVLPKPDTSHKAQHYNTQKAWPEGKMPTAPE